MKTFLRWILPLTLTVAAQWPGIATAQFFGMDAEFLSSSVDQRAVLTIHADGSCSFATETREPRSVAEQQVRLIERYKTMSDNQDDNTPDAGVTTTNETAEPKPFTDEELNKKLTESMNHNGDEQSDDADQTTKVETTKETVIIRVNRSFASLEDMLKEDYYVWRQAGMWFENTRFETDTNGLLRLTLTPAGNMGHYMKTMRNQWKLSGARTEMKLVFPGKVVASGWPAKETNATWLAIDGKHEETLDALAKLSTAPTVITAEGGGLKLGQPLESKKLRRSRGRSGEVGGDLPITDAGPGFAAEAQSISTTTLRVFPDGEDYLKQEGHSFGVETGAVVNVKLFAPKGRTLKSVSGVQVLAAVDDKGRSIGAEAGAAEDADVSSEVDTGGWQGGNSQSGGSVPIELHLQLPPPDAQAIDAISAEAVAVTIGSWKTMTLTNLQENATNELDLSAVLPGAKLVITKFSAKDRQFTLKARLKGSREVQGLDIRASIPGSENFNSNSMDNSSSTKGGETTRNLTIQGFNMDNGTASFQEAMVLTIRQPQDLRRERVKFDLKGMDLF